MSRNQLSEVLDLLRSNRGHHTGMISLYLPATTRVRDALDHVKQEMVEAENVQDKNNRKNVLSALSSIFR